jgi:hypothetical protein
MKTLFVSFAALIFIFFVGCQSSITDPVEQQSQNPLLTAEQENYYSKDAISVWPGTIKVDGILCDPASNICNTQIIGVIRFYVKPVRAANHMATGLKVGIHINATLTNGYTDPNNPWRVFGVSEEFINLVAVPQNVIILKKEFKVIHPSNWGYKLVLTFTVTEKHLNLESMELKKSGTWEPVGDPLF